jgi:hypothetical protein
MGTQKHMKTQRKWIAVLATLAASALTACLAQDTAGYVLAVKGSWTAAPGSAQLAPGGSVSAGSQIKPKDASSSITVAFLDGSAKTFTATFTVASREAPAGSGVSRMVEAVAKRMGSDKRQSVSGMSRGSLEVRPAVLKLTGRRLDLGPAMGSLGAGEYALELRPAAGGDSTEAKCNLDPPSATSATVPVHAGVYSLQVASASGTPVGSATVLVASPEDFESKSAAFRKSVEVTASWPADTDPAAVQQFLSGMLLDLAGPAAR